MIPKKKIEQFVKIVRGGGVVVCNAATRDRLMACAGELSSAAWSEVTFRIAPHMRDGQIAAISHDGGTPTDLTDAETPDVG